MSGPPRSVRRVAHIDDTLSLVSFVDLQRGIYPKDVSL